MTDYAELLAGLEAKLDGANDRADRNWEKVLQAEAKLEAEHYLRESAQQRALQAEDAAGHIAVKLREIEAALMYAIDCVRSDDGAALAPERTVAGQEPYSSQTAKQRYDYCTAEDKPESPLEALRFFCSLAMNRQDWIDVESFFDALTADAAAQRTALLYCYEKLQSMQPFEEWVREIGK